MDAASTHLVLQKRKTSNNKWPQWLLSGSELGKRIYEFDWEQTSLGALDNWPQSLRSGIRMILPNSFAMCIIWGDDYIQLYNDAFIPIAGHNHPGMLGNRCPITWAEIWEDILHPVFQSVRRTGQAVLVESQHFPVLRFGYLEEVYCMVAYSPLCDDEGENSGVLITIAETTAKVLGERRLQTLRDLGSRASEARNTQEACGIAMEVLKQNKADIPFALIYMMDETEETVFDLFATTGIEPGHPAGPMRIAFADTVWPIEKILMANALEVNDIQDRFGWMPGDPWPEPARQAMILPIASQIHGRTIGFLIAGVSPRRELDAPYKEFLTLVAVQVSTAIGNAMAYEAERHRAEALAELDRAKTVFFSNISHEFRTPLTLMLGPLEEMLSHRDRLSHGDREHLSIVHRNGLRLLRLVNSLLDFSRLEAGRMQATYQPTDLSAYTSELASVFRSTMEKAGLILTVDCPPLPEPVYIDRDMWEKIVLNLISNAFKFTFEGGVTVSLSLQDSNVILAVADTGTGIASDELPRVFERFHRVKGANSRTYEGTGIGLSLVKELVNLHGGQVTVDSELGKGSVFTVAIPRGRNHLPVEQIRSGEISTSFKSASNTFVEEALRWLPEDTLLMAENKSVKAQSATMSQKDIVLGTRSRIVLVDDNADMLLYVKRLLEPLYDVAAVTNGKAALVEIQRQIPDLLLTDIMMPGMDGFELLQHLRHDTRTQTLPVIMLSARAGEESSIEGLEAGADDYLVKPFSAKELLARVHSNLMMARIRKEAEESMIQAQKMQVVGQLAGGVAHDFNSLLTVLMGNLKLLERHIGDEAGYKMLNAAFRATEKTSTLTKQLLAFARKQRLERTIVNLNDLLLGIQDLLVRTLGGLVEVNIHLAHDLKTVLIDQNQIELAVLNLVINARDAMPEGGTLTIETKNISYSDPQNDLEPGDYVSLSVSDTGTGISRDVLSHVFEPFFTTKDVGKGTGLGLSQVYGIVKQLGGTTQIKSVLGKGTTVELLLPCPATNSSFINYDREYHKKHA